MARKRTLHPDFFTDPKVLKLEPLQRIFFAGLWCHADKLGVLVDDPEGLSIKILPREASFDPEAALARMETLGLVMRYRDEGHEQPLVWVTHFTRYQRPHPHETNSGLPLPNLSKPKTPKSDQGSPKGNQGSPKVADVSRILRPSEEESLQTAAGTLSVGRRPPRTARPAAAGKPGGEEVLEVQACLVPEQPGPTAPPIPPEPQVLPAKATGTDGPTAPVNGQLRPHEAARAVRARLSVVPERGGEEAAEWAWMQEVRSREHPGWEEPPPAWMDFGAWLVAQDAKYGREERRARWERYQRSSYAASLDEKGCFRPFANNAHKYPAGFVDRGKAQRSRGIAKSYPPEGLVPNAFD